MNGKKAPGRAKRVALRMRRPRRPQPEPALPSVEVVVAVKGAPPAARVASWARSLLFEARAKRASLSVLLCGDARMRTLNRRFRRVSLATDVLSFPSEAKKFLGFLGDLVIDVPYAARQARARGHSLERELKILLAHGLLHLLGYDHETDDGTMFRLQRRLLLSAFGDGPDGVP
jgi:probable rRNA maturation factor